VKETGARHPRCRNRRRGWNGRHDADPVIGTTSDLLLGVDCRTVDIRGSISVIINENYGDSAFN
jgi:hypothetical protein